MSKPVKKIRDKKPVSDNQKISNFFKNLNGKKNETPKTGTTQSPEAIKDIIAATPEYMRPKSQLSHKCKRKLETIDTIDIFDDITNLKGTLKPAQDTERNEPSITDIASTSSGKYPDEIPDMIVQRPPRKKAHNSHITVKVVNLEMQSKKAEQKITRTITSNMNIYKEKTPIKMDNKQIFNSTLIPKERSPTVANNQIMPQKQMASTSGFGKSKYFTSGKKKTPKKTPQKLFSKSPHANQFSFEILPDFIIISPSQSNDRIPIIKTTPKKSNEKKQRSILNYISPKQAETILEVQSLNEHTPVKETIERTVANSTSKAKVRLDFSYDIAISSSIIDDKNMYKKNKIEEYTFDDSWDDTEMEKIAINLNLNLSDSCHCKVLEIDKTTDKRSVTILVQSTKSDEKSYCILKDIWAYTPLAVDNIVRITATKIVDCWEVTQKNGLIVLEPDVLISTTAITTSMFCKRKTALKEKFYGFDPNNKVMIVGTLIHSLLQISLRQKANSKEKVENLMKVLLKSKDTFYTLYFASINLDAIEKEISEFIPRIVSFIEQYICKKNVNREKILPENWKGSIDSIYDIEENIWCPELGLKGKVDITAKIGVATMPIEVKTGRATFSLEHQGQILFYIMMMQKLGYNVPSGFLLYLREGKFKEILMKNRDYSHLISIRNELAYFLTRSTNLVKEDNDDLTVTTMEMPAPLDNRTNICSKCEYNVICSAYLRAENKSDTYPSFKPIQEEVLNHLEQKHLDYFTKWNNLIELENNSKISKKLMSEIFTVPAKEREKKGKCITNVYVTNCVEDHRETFIQTFEKKYKEAVVNFFSSGIAEHSYVVVSSEKRPAIACGLVSSIDFESITIALDRNLLALNPSTAVYHLDTYDSHSSAMFLQSSLSLMLEATPAAQRLRDIVVDRTPTTHAPALHRNVLKHGRSILARLDRSQKMAVLKALRTQEYILIKGMPGTGKTATIVALVQMLVALSQTVLITSHTNLAVDNVCMRLLDCNVAVLRLGIHSKTHEKLQSRSEFTLTEKCKNIDELDELYSKAKVVAVTCMGSKHPLLTKRTFDVCIVDESTQIVQCSLFRPITASKKFILVGDPDQLNPVVHSKEAKKLGLSESLFKYLDNNESTVLLDLNYRMNKTITDLANKLTYRDLLKIGNGTIANATLRIPNIENLHSLYASKRWILSALDDSLAKAVTVVDTGPIWNKPKITWNAGDELTEKSTSPTNKVKTSNQNPYETSIIVTLSYALLQGGVLAKNIGVIAPYQDQVTQLSQFLNPLQIDVSTVDKFQGQDKEIIFFSGTKSYDKKDGTFITEHHILEDNKRLTVAITRSKHKLIIVGDVQTLNFYNPFQKLFAALSKQNVIQLEQNEPDFTWASVVNLDDIKL